MRVRFSAEARAQIVELSRYIAIQASSDVARQYVHKLVGYCNSLSTFPDRGTRRDDIRPGLRVTHFRGKTAIAFAVWPERLEILGVFHGGRDYAAILAERR